MGLGAFDILRAAERTSREIECAAYNSRLVHQEPGSDPLNEPGPWVGVVMGSASDWQTLQHAAAILAEFGVPHECRVISAHRMPDDLFAYAEQAR